MRGSYRGNPTLGTALSLIGPQGSSHRSTPPRFTHDKRSGIDGLTDNAWTVLLR